MRSINSFKCGFFFQTETFFFGNWVSKNDYNMLFWVVGSQKDFEDEKGNEYMMSISYSVIERWKKHENQRCKRLNTPKIFPQKTWYFGVYSGKKIRLCDKNSLRYLKKLLCLFFVTSQYSNTLNYKIFMWLKFQFFFFQKSLWLMAAYILGRKLFSK